MKTKSWFSVLVIFLPIATICLTLPCASYGQAAAAPQAVVQAVQGDATVAVDQDQEPVGLVPGSTIDAWNTVSTDEASKLFVRWNTGILNSLGELTSIFLTSSQTESGPMDSFEMTEGMFRVTSQRGTPTLTPYRVMTPSASIEPVNYDEATDFIVEAHEPTTTVVTVISGSVRVTNTTLERPSQTVVSACQNVYVERGQPGLDVAALTSDDLARLVEGTTIPGSISTAFLCPAPTVELPPPPPLPPSQPYDYEDWGSYDMYPYDEITVLPPQPRVGCVVMLPGIGRWIIPVDVFVGWRFDPIIIRAYCRRVILDHIINCDRYYLTNVRLRRRQLRHMVYLAQLSGNTNLLVEAQRKLADLNVRSHWAAMRLNRLDKNVAALDQEQHKFAQRLPAGKDLFRSISHSFNSPTNLTVARDFRHRVNTEFNVQTQLANVTGKELVDLRSRMARERDPRRRMVLRNELARINKGVAQGKIPIPAKQPQLKQVVERLAKERDPKKVQGLQQQLNGIVKLDVPHTAELLSPARLTSLQQGLAKYPNPHKRQDLEKNVAQLQQSVEARTAAENTWLKVDSISAEAAREKDPRKRNELLGQLKALAHPVGSVSGPAAGLNVLGQRQLLETQLLLEQDKAKRAALEKSLDEQRKHQADLLRQQMEKTRHAEPALRQQEELRKQKEQQILDQKLHKQKQQVVPQPLDRQKLPQQETEQLRKQQEQAERLRHQQEQAEQLRRQEELRKQKEQQILDQKLHKQKQQVVPQPLDRQKLPQQETEQLRKQQEQAERLRHQQEQAEQLRRQEELRKQKEQQILDQKLHKQKQQVVPQPLDRQKLPQQETDQLRKQQEQAERLRHQQEQADQVRRQEELRKQKEQQILDQKLHKQKQQVVPQPLDRQKLQQQETEQLRKQQQADQVRRQQQEQTDRLRHQQQQTDQLRKQQQADQVRRQQQEQTDRLRHQQQQTEQLRKQQQADQVRRQQQEQTDRLRHQQQQTEQVRKQQQADQVRRQQQHADQVRQQQMRQKQQEEENRRKLQQQPSPPPVR